MALSISTDLFVCHRCGKGFGKRQGNFLTSYAQLHKGVGYLPICKKCAQDLYYKYLTTFDDPKLAIKEICRKLDLYWNEDIYKSLIKKNGADPLLAMYIGKLNTDKWAGRSYDDYLEEEKNTPQNISIDIVPDGETEESELIISDEVKRFWGTGYTPEMYRQLEDRRQYWLERLPDEFDTGVGSEAIIRQICALELDINKLRSEGQSVDKLVSTLSNLIGSLNLKPSQKKEQDDQSLASTPLGVWLYRYENERPLPHIEDENKIRKTVFTWMGHVCKMLGKKNAYSQLYENEIERLRVDKPEFDDEDDETFMMDVITSDGGGGDDS